MKLNFINKLVFLFVMLLSIALNAQAQREVVVSGRIVNRSQNKNGKANLPFTDEAVYVYAFPNKAQADEGKSKLEGNQDTFMEGEYAICDENGYYEIKVVDTGYLLFRVGLNKPRMEAVNGRMKIDLALDGGIMLDDVTVVGQLKDIMPTPQASELNGNRFMPYSVFPIPGFLGSSRGRLVIQPFVIDCTTEDTVAYCKPIVYEGRDYHLTQQRWMGFNNKNDLLFPYVKGVRLVHKRTNIEWNDTVLVNDPSHNYCCFADISLENYKKIYYNKTFKVNTCLNRRPLRFLEFNADTRSLNPEDYKEHPQREKHLVNNKINLTFIVGKADLDNNVPSNVENLSRMREMLHDISVSKGTIVKEFVLNATASPEGDYGSNQLLAKNRLNFIKEVVTSAMPASVRNYVFMHVGTEVLSWDVLADTLETQYPHLAQQVREIIKGEKNKNMQQKRIRMLPQQDIINEGLAKLRMISYSCRYEVYRELTKEEIWNSYQTELMTGQEENRALYEYGHLFEMEKDPKRLERLYKRAYDSSIEVNGKPWALAANLLAQSYLKRDTFDVKILDGLIDKHLMKVNVERRRMNGKGTYIVNPEEIVANQLMMYLRAYDYSNASIMAQILPDEPKNDLLRCYALCYGGYYKGDSEQARHIFDVVKKSSLQNEVVMYLALHHKAGDAMAEKTVQNMPEDNAITWYLKAQIYNRKGDIGMMETVQYLMQAFRLDNKFVKIAQTDGDLNEDTVSMAVEQFEAEKQ